MISGRLKQSAHIQARTTARDPFNQQQLVFVEKKPSEPRVPCWVQTINITETSGDRAMAIVNQMFRIYFDPDADIGESDRIAEVLTPDNVVVYKNLDVTGVKHVPGRDGRVHHLEVTAFEYREGISIQFQQPTIS